MERRECSNDNSVSASPRRGCTVGSSLVPRPTPQGGRVWEITLLGAVQLECHGFWIQQTSSFRSSTRLVLYCSNFQNFYVLPYICFLSLFELERWLAGLTFFPLINTTGSIPTVKTLPGIVFCQTLPARFSFPRFCNWGAGEVRARWRVWGRD